jgi:DNA-binding NarL/FixJ family response regulator
MSGTSGRCSSWGSRGYLRKTASGEEIVAALRAVSEGQTVLGSEATRAAIGAGAEPLTAREYEVLRLMATGQRNAEIAAALGVAVQTVEFHISHLFAKLGARSRTEVIAKAHQQGLVSLEAPEAGPP